MWIHWEASTLFGVHFSCASSCFMYYILQCLIPRCFCFCFICFIHDTYFYQCIWSWTLQSYRYIIIQLVLFWFYIVFCFFVRILKPAAGSAPSLPSYSYRMSQAAQFTRPRASPPPAVCRQTSAGGASPNTRRCSMTVQGLGVTRQQTQLADGRIGRAPSTPAFCGLQPSSGSPVMKVIHTRLLTLGFGSFCLSRRLFSQLQ